MTEKCFDVCCLPGLVHCDGYGDYCVTPDQCCELHNKHYCPHTRNHECVESIDYSVGTKCDHDKGYLKCYDWCCEEDEFYCND